MSNKKGFKVFMISFVVSLIILGSMFFVFLLYMKVSIADTPKNDVPYKSSYKPQESENLSVLVIGCEDKSKLPTFFHIIRYDAVNSAIYPIALSPQTLCTIDKKEQTLSQAYDYYGVDGGVRGCENLFSCEISKYLRVDISQIEDIISFLGGVDYEVIKKTTYKERTIDAGNQLLDGRRFATFMFANEKVPVAQSDLLQSLFRSKFNKTLLASYDTFIKKIFACNDTDLCEYDIMTRKTGFTHSLLEETLLMKSIETSGDYDESETKLVLNQSSIDTVAAILAD
ncbi:MAG: LCP family protein [Oscillospiraceae bacterium]